MYRAISLLILCALMLGLSGAPVQAQEPEMNPAAIVETVYGAVGAKDLATAGSYLADDVVLVILPPPPGTNGTFVGKEAVLGWYENLVQDNTTVELSDAEVSGDRFTIKNVTRMDGLPVESLEFDGAGIVQDGLVKAMSWVMTPSTVAEMDAAFAKMANAELVRRYSDELWSEGKLDVADEILAEDFVDHTPRPGVEPTREGLKNDVAGFHEKYGGNASFRIDDIIADDDSALLISTMLMKDESGTETELDQFMILLHIADGLIQDRTALQVASWE